ncbi:MAG: hypothetical protein GY803_08290, partial [Chloroflexi bacterium]|nr:hypothetical protein [Chloroflexota bacterium]
MMSRKLLSLALIFAVLAICALSVGGLAASAGGAAANFELARAVQAQAEANEAQAHALTAQAISDIAGDLLLVIVIIFGFGAKA